MRERAPVRGARAGTVEKNAVSRLTIGWDGGLILGFAFHTIDARLAPKARIARYPTPGHGGRQKVVLDTPYSWAFHPSGLKFRR